MSPCSLPQYVYPAAAYMSSPGVALPVSPHSPLSPTTAGGLSLDYATAAAGYPAAAAQLPAAYEAAYPYTTTANYAAPAAYQAYAAAAAASVPSAQPTIGHFAAPHYQAQQLQERLH